jgi:flagellar assembly protein FliH
MSDRKRGFLRPGQDGDVVEAQVWGLPDYGKTLHSEAQETALNYDPQWQPYDEEDPEEEPHELTLAELEQIRDDAYQEGLLQGKEAGFKEGYDKGKEQGFEEGRQAGVDVGVEQGLAQGQATIAEHVNSFIQLADQFAQPLELMNAQVEKQLVDMVLSLTREVTHVEVSTNPQVILDTIKRCVDALPITGHEITLKLNPEDEQIVVATYSQDELDARQWHLVAEPALSRGDVEIQAGESTVSYQMEERIKSVLTEFIGRNRQGA